MDRGSPQDAPEIFCRVSGAGRLRDCGVYGDLDNENTAWGKTGVNFDEASLVLFTFSRRLEQGLNLNQCRMGGLLSTD